MDLDKLAEELAHAFYAAPGASPKMSEARAKAWSFIRRVLAAGGAYA